MADDPIEQNETRETAPAAETAPPRKRRGRVKGSKNKLKPTLGPSLKDRLESVGTAPVVLGGNQEREGEKREAEEQEAERVLNDLSTSARERELGEENERLRDQLAKLEKRWVYGDYKDLPGDFPFEVTIQSTPEPGGTSPVPLNCNSGLVIEYEKDENGDTIPIKWNDQKQAIAWAVKKQTVFEIKGCEKVGDMFLLPREIPLQVPKVVVEILEGSKYKAWERVVVDGVPKATLVQYHRYPYSARPLYHLAA